MHASLISILTTGAAAVLAVTGFAAPGSAPLLADKSPTAVPVDVELVLAWQVLIGDKHQVALAVDVITSSYGCVFATLGIEHGVFFQVKDP